MNNGKNPNNMPHIETLPPPLLHQILMHLPTEHLLAPILTSHTLSEHGTALLWSRVDGQRFKSLSYSRKKFYAWNVRTLVVTTGGHWDVGLKPSWFKSLEAVDLHCGLSFGENPLAWMKRSGIELTTGRVGMLRVSGFEILAHEVGEVVGLMGGVSVLDVSGLKGRGRELLGVVGDEVKVVRVCAEEHAQMICEGGVDLRRARSDLRELRVTAQRGGTLTWIFEAIGTLELLEDLTIEGPEEGWMSIGRKEVVKLKGVKRLRRLRILSANPRGIMTLTDKDWGDFFRSMRGLESFELRTRDLVSGRVLASLDANCSSLRQLWIERVGGLHQELLFPSLTDLHIGTVLGSRCELKDTVRGIAKSWHRCVPGVEQKCRRMMTWAWSIRT